MDGARTHALELVDTEVNACQRKVVTRSIQTTKTIDFPHSSAARLQSLALSVKPGGKYSDGPRHSRHYCSPALSFTSRFLSWQLADLNPMVLYEV